MLAKLPFLFWLYKSGGGYVNSTIHEMCWEFGEEGPGIRVAITWSCNSFSPVALMTRMHISASPPFPAYGTKRLDQFAFILRVRSILSHAAETPRAPSSSFALSLMERRLCHPLQAPPETETPFEHIHPWKFVRDVVILAISTGKGRTSVGYYKVSSLMEVHGLWNWTMDLA